MLLIKNGLISDAIHENAYEADILIDGTKIIRIGKEIECEGADVFDASGYRIFPGFIDVHTHIGMFGYAGFTTKDDVEEYDRCTPNNRGIDCINPREDTFEKALRGGVTTICTGPGSVNCIGGTHIAMKTYGHTVKEMVVKDPVAMKIAFGENPKVHLRDKLTTRMSIASSIRDTLYSAKEYYERKQTAGDDLFKKPKYDPKMEALIPVIKKEIPLKAHCHRNDDIMTAIRIAQELDCNLTLEHVKEGIFVLDELVKAGYPIAVGPYFAQVQKTEAMQSNPADAVKMIKAGCCISVMTDSPIVAEDLLPLCAGLFMREGLSEFEALRTITINPAKHLGIADRVGSIEEGKDADLVLSHGCPMDMRDKAEIVFVNGVRRV